MPLSFSSIQTLLFAYPAIQNLILAYSGGVDSHVLLHLLATHRHTLAGRTLAAVYVDHGLQPAATQWGRHCEQTCRHLGMDFKVVQVNARPQPGESPEAAARRARYQALENLLGAQDALLTAHQRDDQAETLLLQLLRGAGIHGLAAMPVVAPLGRGWLLRPLLDSERTEILAYARFHGLHWIEDASNVNRELDRNYLRHAILPPLKVRWPATTATLSRSARWCAEAAALLDELADADLALAVTTSPACLDILLLRTLDEKRQSNALRRWFRRLQLPVPTASQLHHILHDAIAAPRDRQPLIHWSGGEVRRYRNRLFAMAPLLPHDPSLVFPLTPETSELLVPGIGRLRLCKVRGEGVRLAALAGAALTIRFRRGGERLRPTGRSHSQELKKLLQEAGIPPWERDRLPLLYVNESLAVVTGLWVEAEFMAPAEEDGLVLECRWS